MHRYSAKMIFFLTFAPQLDGGSIDQTRRVEKRSLKTQTILLNISN